MSKITDNIQEQAARIRNDAMADLEHEQLANIINRMDDHLTNVLAQRDTLLAVLRDALKYADSATENVENKAAFRKLIRAAIAQAEGGQAQ